MFTTGVVGNDYYYSSPMTWCAGDYQLAQQEDGNLVIYKANSGPIWASHTYNSPGAQLHFQGDGNIVLYPANNSTNALWATGTYNHPGDEFRVQTDGNLVVYNSSGAAVWALGT
jgi:hypothetical protein